MARKRESFFSLTFPNESIFDDSQRYTKIRYSAINKWIKYRCLNLLTEWQWQSDSDNKVGPIFGKIDRVDFYYYIYNI